jgi:hypothetical protein
MGSDDRFLDFDPHQLQHVEKARISITSTVLPDCGMPPHSDHS